MNRNPRTLRATMLAATVMTSLLMTALGVHPASAADAARQIPHSVLEGLPGYQVPPNPDSAAVRRGRRDAPRPSMPLSDGRKSMPALMRSMIAALNAEDEPAFESLCVTQKEFSVILWPEMPNSAPASGATAEDAWYFLWHRLHGGVRSAISDQGGKQLTYLGYRESLPRMRFRNYQLVRGLRIATRDAEGTVDTLTFVRTVVERNGDYKIYSMKD